MKISKKKHLEIALEKVPKHPNPKVELEQYSTPAAIAADFLWNARALGDIERRNVLDIGCGCGILAIASSLMNSNFSLGIDVDCESVDLARKTSEEMHIGNLDFAVGDINDFDSIHELLNGDDSNTAIKDIEFDTVIQNPPFGSQEKSKKHADRKFMEFALNSADVSYSFHMASTEEFVIDFYRDLGADVTHKLVYKFPIPKTYDFHTKDSRDVKVVVLRAEKL